LHLILGWGALAGAVPDVRAAGLILNPAVRISAAPTEWLYRSSNLPSTTLQADAAGVSVGGCVVTAIRIGPDGFVSPTARARPLLSQLYVSPQHRRLGIARQLIHASEQAALEWGYVELMLHVHQHNSPAVRLYASLGFEEEEEEPRWQDWSIAWGEGLFSPKIGRRLSMSKRLAPVEGRGSTP